jgi:hypothetical protein
MPVVVRRPAPPLDELITAITYRAGEQPCTSVEKILPGPETGLWVNLNRDEFRSFGESGQVSRRTHAVPDLKNPALWHRTGSGPRDHVVG